MTSLLTAPVSMTLEAFLEFSERQDDRNHYELDEGELITLSPSCRQMTAAGRSLADGSLTSLPRLKLKSSATSSIGKGAALKTGLNYIMVQ